MIQVPLHPDPISLPPVHRARGSARDLSRDPFSPLDRERLNRGLRWWVRSFESRALLDRLDDIMEVAGGQDVPLEVGVRQERRRLGQAISILLDACTTEIERKMVEPLLIVSRYAVDHVGYQVGGVVRGDQPGGTGDDYICIQPQAPVAGYVADFLLEFRGWRFMRVVEAEGNVREMHVRTHVAMVVECDGREAHDVTGPQREHDRRRDRELQAIGYLTRRYSGAQISANPWCCVQNAIAVLLDWAATEGEMRRAA